MRFNWKLLVLLIMATCSLAQAHPYTLTPAYATLDDFRLVSGTTLQQVVVEYATLGEPRRDASGAIVNAVLNPHGWSGNYAQTLASAGALVGPGRPLDPARYYIIFPTSLGSPGSSSPSVSGLGAAFPSYTIADMVNAQYRLVTQRLGIKRLAGVIGASMGGYQTLQWITAYPEMMDWAVPITTAPQARGRMLGIFGMMSFTIASDPGYANGTYSTQPRDAMRRAMMATYPWYVAGAYLDAKFKSEAEIMAELRNVGLSMDNWDANDLIWRNQAMASFDVSADLSRVTAKVLLVGVAEDELFPPEQMIVPTAAKIAGAKCFVYASPMGHVGGLVDIGKAADVILQHIRDAERWYRQPLDRPVAPK